MKTSPASTSAPTITRSEWRFVAVLLVIVLALTSLPYLFGYLVTPPGKQFMGLMQDVPDHGQYLAWWRSFQSSFLVPNKLTPEPNQPLFFNLQWWLLAQVSKLTGMGYPAVYQLLRLLAGAFLGVGLYRLLAVLFNDPARRKTAFSLALLGSGFGWLLVVMKYTVSAGELPFPLLVFNAESNYFLCLLGYPHFALAAGMIALSLEFVLRGWHSGRLRDFVIAGVWAALLGWMHAYDLFIIYGVTAAFFLLVWITRRTFPLRFLWGGLILGLLSGWGALYSFLLTTLDPLWKEVLSQFDNAGVYTPLPPGLFFLYGIPLFLAVVGLVMWLREKKWSDARLFLAGWFVVGFLLLYVPTDFQIHMLNSWQIPVVAMAAALLHDNIIPALFRRFTGPVFGRPAVSWLPVLVVLLVLPTNLYLWAWRFVELNRAEYPFYLQTDYVDALDWLRVNGPQDEVVLSSLTVGQYIPAVSGKTAFLAHWANTVNFYDKEQRVQDFFDLSAPEAQRLDTISQYRVSYVLAGPAERSLGQFSPGSESWVKPVFTAGDVTVYQVQPAELSKALKRP